jgi:predicted transcriptional regulator
MSKRSRQQGELENLVLNLLWSTEVPLTSQQILDKVTISSDLALTTILTVLSRLEEKGLVVREPGESRAFLFAAAQSRQQHTADLMLKLVANESNPALAFARFAEGLTAAQLKALRKSLDG